jgi:hypothetical protein
MMPVTQAQSRELPESPNPELPKNYRLRLPGSAAIKAAIFANAETP